MDDDEREQIRSECADILAPANKSADFLRRNSFPSEAATIYNLPDSHYLQVISDVLMLSGTTVAKNVFEKENGGEGKNHMRIDTLFFTALLLTGTGLWTRIAIQGVELALLSTAMEWSMSRIRAGAKLLPNTAVSCHTR